MRPVPCLWQGQMRKHRKGGHDVPEDKIISRYHRTYIFDNTITQQLGAVLSEGKIAEQNRDSPQWITDTLDRYLADNNEKSFLIERAKENQKACSISLINKSEYRGKIKFIGKHYAVQDISDTEAILHHISLIDPNIAASQSITIKYGNGVSSVATS